MGTTAWILAKALIVFPTTLGVNVSAVREANAVLFPRKQPDLVDARWGLPGHAGNHGSGPLWRGRCLHAQGEGGLQVDPAGEENEVSHLKQRAPTWCGLHVRQMAVRAAGSRRAGPSCACARPVVGALGAHSGLGPGPTQPSCPVYLWHSRAKRIKR